MDVACEWCTSLNICTRLKSCKLQLTLVWSLKGQHFKSLFSVLEKSCICPGSANTSTFILKQLVLVIVKSSVIVGHFFGGKYFTSCTRQTLCSTALRTIEKHNGIKFNFYSRGTATYKLDIVIVMFMSHQDI